MHARRAQGRELLRTHEALRLAHTKLQQRHAVDIKVQSEREAGQSDTRCITLLGPPSSTAGCKREIEEILQQFEELRRQEGGGHQARPRRRGQGRRGRRRCEWRRWW